jgi:hypothetical protein
MLFLAVAARLPFPLPLSTGVLAYGPGPGVELIPYFLGLVTWAGLAFAAVLLSPLAALLRRLRRARGAPPATHKPAAPARGHEPEAPAREHKPEAPAREPEPESTPLTASVPESPGEGSHDRA